MLGSKIKFCADLLTLHITKITVKYYHPVFLKFPVVSLFPAGTVPLILTVLSDSVLSDSVHSALYLPVAAEAASPVADMPATAVSRTVVPAVALPVSSLNIYTGRIHQG